MEEIFDYEYKLQELYYPCVYFLLKDDKVVYVGQTECGLKRILCHVQDKDFDSVRVVRCEKCELDDMETRMIAKYQPIYNKSLTNAVSASRIKLALIERGYRVRRDTITRWVIQNTEYYTFFGNVYVPDKNKENVINGIIDFITKNA